MQPRQSATRSDIASGDPLRDLAALGLGLNEARVYLALLASGSATAARVAERAGVSRPKVYEVLRSLERRGFCAVGAGRISTYRPVPPQVALTGWIGHREHERRLAAERDEVLAAHLLSFLPAPEEISRRPALDYLEAVFGRARTSEALERLIGTAERHVDMIQQPPFLQPRTSWNVAEVAALRRGVHVRVLYSRDAAVDSLRWRDLAEAGGELRVASHVPMKLLIRDGVEAMISLRDPSTGEQGLTSAVIKHPDLVGPLQLLFSREWRKGRPIQPKEFE